MNCLGLVTFTCCLLGVVGRVRAEWYPERIPRWSCSSAEQPAWEQPLQALRYVWQRLPERIEVFPGENYVYWRVQEGDVQVRGNVRLAKGAREQGLLNIGYGRYRGSEMLSQHHAALGPEQALLVSCPGSLEVRVTFEKKEVLFRLADIPQDVPEWLKDDPELSFVQRTHDDSGTRFLLCHHRAVSTFLWLRDEAFTDNETLEPSSPGSPFRRGNRSGFLYAPWGEHWWLWAVPKRQLVENLEYDGPFDQLSDNFALALKTKDWLEKVHPDLRGRIDELGAFLPGKGSGRVALKNYGVYENDAQILKVWQAGRPEQAVRRFLKWWNLPMLP
jgi:hypothetical protein